MTAQALIMLLSWPVVVAILFGRMARADAALWSILAGYLLLPPATSIDLPMIPPIDKSTIPAMAAFFFAITRGGDDTPTLPRPPFAMVALIALMLVVPLVTAITNPDTLIDGIVVRPAIGIVQAIGESIVTGFHLLPFLLGYWLLSDHKGPLRLGRALVVAMLVYSIPMLIEIRLSPQINVWVYGFFQHSFAQTMRYGSFRPIVFLQHPLWLAFLTFSALACAIAFAKVERNQKAYGIAGYLGLILIMCKTLGVLLHLAIAGPLLWFAKPRLAVFAAFLIGAGVCVYPLMRAQPWMPVDQLISFVTERQADRGQSFGFRLENETILLARAQERPLAGWGGWGRAQLVDPVTGLFTTTVDGEWIRILGERGILGFIAEFGLLLLPLFMLWRAWPKTRDGPVTAPEMLLVATALILALNMLDLLPNATITPVTWLMGGVVAGSAVRIRQGTYFAQDFTRSAGMMAKKTGLKTVL